MSDLTELLERVEKATGPDREIDKAVFVALVDPQSEKNYWGWQGSRPQGSPPKPVSDYWDRRHTPEITASIDAALALVERTLPDWQELRLQLSIATGPGGYCNAHLIRDTFVQDIEVDQVAPGRTAPLAILAALLRALIAQQAKP